MVFELSGALGTCVRINCISPGQIDVGVDLNGVRLPIPILDSQDIEFCGSLTCEA
jgi:hypothetical protein